MSFNLFFTKNERRTSIALSNYGILLPIILKFWKLLQWSEWYGAADKNRNFEFKEDKATTRILSDALDLCRPFACWVSLACRLLSLFLCLSLAPYSKFVDMTINLILVLYTTRIQKQFPLSFLVFIDSLAASVLQEAGGYAISRQNNLELHLGCIWVNLH